MTAMTKTQHNVYTSTGSQPNGLRQLGGIAGIIAGATFIFGFALFVTLLEPLVSGELTAIETVEFLRDNQNIFYVWNLVIYVLFGIVQAILTLALHDRLKRHAMSISQIAAVFGLVWTGLVIASGMISNVGAAAVIDLLNTDPIQAGTVWLAVDAVSIGLGGGNEIVGGLWLLLLSWAAMRGSLPKALNYFGILVGAAGIVTLVPPLAEVGMIFGLGIIVWYIWVGIVLLRREPALA